MSNDVPNLRGGHAQTLMFVIALVAPCATIAGFIWKAAQYPDRTEFRPVVNDVAAMKQDVAIMKYRQDGNDRQLSELKVTTDKILEALRERRGRDR